MRVSLNPTRNPSRQFRTAAIAILAIACLTLGVAPNLVSADNGHVNPGATVLTQPVACSTLNVFWYGGKTEGFTSAGNIAIVSSRRVAVFTTTRQYLPRWHIVSTRNPKSGKFTIWYVQSWVYVYVAPPGEVIAAANTCFRAKS